jgi:hypothetical protein
MPTGAELMAGPLGISDPRAVRVTVLNHEVNFGHEYVYHCHILAHEEMDMMHSMIFAVAPSVAPSAFAAAASPDGTAAELTWTYNAVNSDFTGFTIQRSTDPLFPVGATTVSISVSDPAARAYTDTPATPGNYYYRIAASNVVGDTFDYAGSTDFPHPAINTAFLEDPTPVTIIAPV